MVHMYELLLFFNTNLGKLWCLIVHIRNINGDEGGASPRWIALIDSLNIELDPAHRLAVKRDECLYLT